MSPQDILAVVIAKQLEHPELRQPPTWSELRRVIAREDVDILVAPLPRPAQLVQYGGAWTIVISSEVAPSRYTYYALHELGHLWLHHDTTAERWERVYTMDAAEPDGPREYEAEVFVAIILGGLERFNFHIDG